MRLCAWCRGELSPRARADAKTCSQRCRQAAHRFQRGLVVVRRSTSPLRFAYADPPYPGKAGYYREHPDFAGEVDHAELVASLTTSYDGWALSTSAAALRDVLALCPPDVRVAAWFRGARPHATSGVVLSSWEPVVFAGARWVDPSWRSPSDASRVAGVDERRIDSPVVFAGARWVDPSWRSPSDASRVAGVDERRIDSLQHVARARTTDPDDRVIGAKPAAFCWWLFQLLGLQPGDTFVDLFPGSGGVGRAWQLLEASCGSDADTSGRPGADVSCRSASDSSPEYSSDASCRASADGSVAGENLHDP